MPGFKFCFKINELKDGAEKIKAKRNSKAVVDQQQEERKLARHVQAPTTDVRIGRCAM